MRGPRRQAELVDDKHTETSEDGKALSSDGNIPPSTSLLDEADNSRDFLVVDAAWLCQNLRFPSMQDALKNGALVRRSQVECCFFISHRWENPDNPDPFTVQAVTVAENVWETVQRGARIGFWYDFSCLPQKPRTKNEEDVFRRDLKRLPEIQAHCKTRVVCRFVELPAHLHRGWCLLEMMSPDWELWSIRLGRRLPALLRSLRRFPDGPLAKKMCRLACQVEPFFFSCNVAAEQDRTTC